jgi:hypothetical protein
MSIGLPGKQRLPVAAFDRLGRREMVPRSIRQRAAAVRYRSKISSAGLSPAKEVDMSQVSKATKKRCCSMEHERLAAELDTCDQLYKNPSE